MNSENRFPDTRRLKAFRNLDKAVTLERSGRLADADKAYASVIKKHPDYFDALHLYGLFKFKIGNLSDAIKLVERAHKVNPKSLNAVNSLGVIHAHLRSFDSALAYFNKIIESDNNNLQALSNKAQCLNELGRFQEAIEVSDKILSSNNLVLEAYVSRAAAFLELHLYEKALLNYKKSVELNPEYQMGWCGIGNVFFRLKRFDEGLAAYDKALSIKPDLADAWLGRGNVFYDLKRYDQAFSAYDKALSIKPDLADAWLGRGNVFYDLKRYHQALAAYDRTLSIKPDLAEAWLGRGNVFCDLKRHDQALAAYDKTLSIKPDLAEAWLGRGNVFADQRRYGEAFSSYDNACSLKHDLASAEGIRLFAKMNCCIWSNLDSESESLFDSIRAGKRNAPPFVLLATDASPADRLRCADIWVRDHCRVVPPESPGATTNKNDKIRVGYLSADFRTHPVGYLAAGLFENHNRSRFENFGFSIGPNDKSEIRIRIERSFDHFFDLVEKSDAEIVETIRSSGIDILVDLMGHTQGARLEVLGQRPARIMVNFLGFAGTVGGNLLDYVIADGTVIPADDSRYFSEKVVYLPHSFMPHDRTTRTISATAVTRDDHDLPKDAFVFCCFNNAYKLTPRTFESWMSILKRVDGSVLWLSDLSAIARDNLRREAATHGIESSRIVFAKRLDSMALHLARHCLADLFLDTLPYNAHSTASDALWAGLPVLTRIGDSFAGRVAASLLNAVGLPELITHSRQEYESLAIELAFHRDRLASIKEKLDGHRLTVPLFNTALFTRHLEAAYEEMYRRHRSGLPRDHIEIRPLKVFA